MELSNEFEVAAGIDEAWTVLTDLERIAPCLPGATLKEVADVDGTTEYRGTVKVKVGPVQATYKGEAHIVEADRGAGRVLLVAAGREARGQGTASASIEAILTERDGDDGPITHVGLVTDLSITGKVAQFGRGVLGEVSGKLLDQFVQNVEATVLSGEAGADDDGADEGGEDRLEVVESIEVEVVEVIDTDTGEVVAEAVEVTDTIDLVDTETGEVVAEVVEVTDAIGTVDPDTGEVEVASVRSIEAVEAEPIDLLDTAGTPVLKRLVPVVLAVVVGVVVVGVLRRRRR
ncbi:MAG: SRPBCC family protein [Acidimicrobiales bacterium]